MAANLATNLYFDKLHEEAIQPHKGTRFSAGSDVYTYYDISVKAGKLTTVCTGIRVFLSPKCYGRIAARSSLAKNLELLLWD